MEAYLTNAPTTVFNNNVDFTVTINDPCIFDSVSIPSQTAIQSFTYYITQGASPVVKSPVI